MLEGTVMGGGFGLACVSAVTLARDHVSFRLPETSLGIVPAQIAPFVVRRLGDARARDWLLSGARWTAPQAVSAGLVNSVAEGDFDPALLSLLKRLVHAAPAAVTETKQLLAAIEAGRGANEVLDDAALAFARALRGQEAALGLKAFAAREPAPWAVTAEDKP